MTFTHALSTNNYGEAKFIVSSLAANGTHTTIASAIASASAGDTIFIRPGTYTENLALKAGVNLVSFSSDDVTIIGKMTYSSSGSVILSNLNFQTNSDFILELTGSSASSVAFIECNLNVTNNTAISYTSSSSSSGIALANTGGNLTTTGITYFSSSGAGNITINKCQFENTGASTTASTSSAGNVSITNSRLVFTITTSGTGAIQIQNSQLIAPSNLTMLTHGGSGTSYIYNSYINSGTSSAISVGGTLRVGALVVDSTNTNAITGAGTLINSGVSFINTSSVINTSTVTARNFDVGGISFDNGTNTLSVFQQGTFSPTVRGSSTAGTVAMGTQLGRYQKVGRLVSISMLVDWTTIGTATGAVQINNLPYTVLNNNAALASSYVSPGLSGITTTANASAYMTPQTNTTTVNINQYVGGASATGAATVITASNGFTCNLKFETA